MKILLICIALAELSLLQLQSCLLGNGTGEIKMISERQRNFYRNERYIPRRKPISNNSLLLGLMAFFAVLTAFFLIITKIYD